MNHLRTHTTLHSMRVRRAALVLMTLLCSAAPARGADRVIVALGDSLTDGLGVAREGYDYRVVNAGVSGDTSAGGPRRLDWVLPANPEIVIVALGANDGLRG